MDATELADALLHRPLTEARVSKLRRHLAPHPWTRPSDISAESMTKLLDAIEAHELGGVGARAFVHNALVNAPRRTLPPLPKDIAEKLEAFQVDRAKRQAASR